MCVSDSAQQINYSDFIMFSWVCSVGPISIQKLNIYLGSLSIVPIGNSISVLLLCKQRDALEDRLIRYYEIKSER